MLLPDCDALRSLVHDLLLAVPPGESELLNELEFALLALRDEQDPRPANASPLGSFRPGLTDAIEQIERLIDQPRPVADLIALGVASRHLVRARMIVEGRE